MENYNIYKTITGKYIYYNFYSKKFELGSSFILYLAAKRIYAKTENKELALAFLSVANTITYARHNIYDYEDHYTNCTEHYFKFNSHEEFKIWINDLIKKGIIKKILKRKYDKNTKLIFLNSMKYLLNNDWKIENKIEKAVKIVEEEKIEKGKRIIENLKNKIKELEEKEIRIIKILKEKINVSYLEIEEYEEDYGRIVEQEEVEDAIFRFEYINDINVRYEYDVLMRYNKEELEKYEKELKEKLKILEEEYVENTNF